MSPWRRWLHRLRRHPGDAVLLARVLAISAVVSLLLRRVGVAATARRIRPRPRPRARPGALRARRAEALVAFADPATSRWMNGVCLQRSLVLYRLLNLEGVPVDLEIGLRARSGAVDGHAWLSVGGLPVFEHQDPRDEFRPTLRFPSPLVAGE